MQYELVDLGPYSKYFGKVGKDFRLMVHGEPGAGKTVFLLKFANWLAHNKGPVLYISNEEYGSPTLSEKLKLITNKTNPISERLSFAEFVPESLDGYVAVFFDSAQTLRLTDKDFHKIREHNKDKMLIVILQRTKGGVFKGEKDWDHNMQATASVHFDDGGQRVLSTSKNRYYETIEKAI